MKNVDEVQEELQRIFTQLEIGEISPKEAEALHNNVGKQIGLTKLKLEYASLRKEKPKTAFLEGHTEKT